MARLLDGDLCEGASTEAHRQAYNAAFEELGFNWRWDAVTFERLPDQGREGLRAYLQKEQPHLLRAYDADFLADAIEAAKARFYAAMTGSRSTATWYLGGAAVSSARQAA